MARYAPASRRSAEGFSPPIDTYIGGTAANGVAVGDFNRDGNADLVVGGQDAGVIFILLGNGDGTFRNTATYATGYDSQSFAIVDFNGDGISDIAVANIGYPRSAAR